MIIYVAYYMELGLKFKYCSSARRLLHKIYRPRGTSHAKKFLVFCKLSIAKPVVEINGMGYDAC